MTNILSKCGICCSEVEEVSHHHPFQPTKILGAQLNVIFILKHIYELKSDDLESYLRKWGNPGDWLKLCPNCEDDISNVRGVFEKLHQTSRELEKAKLGLQEKIKNSEWRKVVHRTRKQAEAGVEEALNECRRTICNRRRRRRPLVLKNPFEVGDLKASELALIPEVNVKEENNGVEDEDVANPEFEFYDENPSPEGHYFDFKAASDDPVSDADNKEPVVPSPVRKSRRPVTKTKYSEGFSDEEVDNEDETGNTCLKTTPKRTGKQVPLRKSRRSLKKIKYSEAISHQEEVDGEETENRNCSKAKAPPTRNETQVPNATATATALRRKDPIWRKIKCPVCKTEFQVFGTGFATFSKHLQTCVSSVVDTSHVDLMCSLCKKFSCGSGASGIRDFLEHIAVCRRRYKGDQSEIKSIPWRDALIKCNLCEREYSYYIPYPDYIQHIFNYHQHRFICSQCPFRCRISANLGRNHWKAHHKNMLHVPLPERYRIETEKAPLPHIPWWCPGPDCLQEFWDECSRDEHLKTCQKYLPERSQICSFCDRKYFIKEELLMHRVSVHGYLALANAHKCHECDIIFENARQLGSHQRRKHGINLFGCNKCEQKFEKCDDLWDHVRLVHGHKNEEERKEFTCPHCAKVFGLKYKLRDHIFHVHEKKPNELSMKPPVGNRDHNRTIVRKSYQLKRPTTSCLCSFCGKSFSSVRSLRLHTKICRLPQFKCRECKLRFATGEFLKGHKVKVHQVKPKTSPEDGEKPIRKRKHPDPDKPRRKHQRFDFSMVTLSEDKTSGSCNICSKNFSTIQKLKAHVRLSHFSSSKCGGCGKEFKYQNNCRRHMKKCPAVAAAAGRAAEPMSKAPKVICDLCGVEVCRSNLRLHYLNVHENKKNLPVSCDICRKRVPFQHQMLQHKSRVHKIGDFKCDVEGCSRVFWKARLLEKHKKFKHEGVSRPRNHFCQFCGKGLSTNEHLKQHEQAMHTNKDSKPFKCELCEKTFATRLYKTYHLKHTHKLPKGKLETENCNK